MSIEMNWGIHLITGRAHTIDILPTTKKNSETFHFVLDFFLNLHFKDLGLVFHKI